MKERIFLVAPLEDDLTAFYVTSNITNIVVNKIELQFITLCVHSTAPYAQSRRKATSHTISEMLMQSLSKQRKVADNNFHNFESLFPSAPFREPFVVK